MEVGRARAGAWQSVANASLEGGVSRRRAIADAQPPRSAIKLLIEKLAIVEKLAMAARGQNDARVPALERYGQVMLRLRAAEP